MTGPLRVLMTADAVGGVWTYATELARALGDQGVETVLAVLGPPPSRAQRDALAGVAKVTLVETDLPLDWLCDGAAPILAAGATITSLAARHRVDLVHYNMPSLAAAALPKLPTVAVAHGCVATWWEAAKETPLDESFRWHRALTGEGLRAVDRVVAPTAAYARTVARQYSLPRCPAAIHNGRTPFAFPPQPIDDSVLTVGRLWDPVKGAGLLDRVAARLAVPFHAAGPVEGPHGERVALDHLHPLGPLDEVELAAWLARRPVFVSAASFEPFGLAVLEAAQAGCALVLSDIAAFRELWDGAALFVPVRDEQGYAQAIERLIHDTAEREAIGRTARARAERYTPQATAAAMLKLYRGLIAAHHPSAKAAA